MRNRFILVADTSDAFLDILTEALATTDYALVHAKDGQKAIDYLEMLESQIDLAIIELELPVVSGLDVIWRLARWKQPNPTRIIATTAVDVPLLKQVVKELGVDAVIQIPIPVQSWRQTIEAVLSGELSGADKLYPAESQQRKCYYPRGPRASTASHCITSVPSRGISKP